LKWHFIALQIFSVISIFQRAKALKQKKEEGNEVFKSGRLTEAYNLYSEALKIDPNNKSTNAKLFFNRATVCSKVVFEII
jgi:DnaJ family protein C protein 7